METLEEMLIRHESLRLRPYRDSVGKLTLGVGRNLDDVGITTDEALLLLSNDILKVYRGLKATLPFWEKIDATRQRVLANMAFNMGVSGLLGFKKMLAAIEMGHYHEAADEMLSSKWAAQVGKRATELAELMKSGGAE